VTRLPPHISRQSAQCPLGSDPAALAVRDIATTVHHQMQSRFGLEHCSSWFLNELPAS
jgi:hypothetical protein